jgi:tetratricopeptide (TPR) repeat protein
MVRRKHFMTDKKAIGHLEAGNTACDRGRWDLAAAEYDKALSIFESDGDIPNLASAMASKGKALGRLGNLAEALKLWDQSIRYFQNLLRNKWDAGYAFGLGQTIYIKAENLRVSDVNEEAVKTYTQAIELFEKLIYEEKFEDDEAKILLASSWDGKGKASFDDTETSIAAFDRAIRIRNRLVDEGMLDMRESLAESYFSKATVLSGKEGTLESLDNSERIVQQLIREGKGDSIKELLSDLQQMRREVLKEQRIEQARRHINSGNEALNAQDWQLAKREIENAVKLWEEVGNQSQLVAAQANLATVISNLGEEREAIRLWNLAMGFYQEQLRKKWSPEHARFLGCIALMKGSRLESMGEFDDSLRAYNLAIENLRKACEESDQTQIGYYLQEAENGKRRIQQISLR